MSDKKKPTGTSSLSSQVDSLTQPVFAKRGFLEARLMRDWPLIAGKKLAHYTMPQRIFFPDKETRNNGVLHLEVSNSAISMEITYNIPILLEKMAVHLGYKAISSIKTHLRPRALQPMETQSSRPSLSVEKNRLLLEAVSKIEDPALRDALYHLGEYVMAKEGNEVRTR